LIFEGGHSNGPTTKLERRGAAILAENAFGLHIENCVFRDNFAEIEGALRAEFNASDPGNK